MTAERSPAFQFYPADFLSDHHVIAMTLAERGAYITLLCVCWMHRRIPATMPALARICKCSPGYMEKMWPALEVCFTREGDFYIQGRIERERQKQAQFRALKADAGRRGGRPKADGKQNESRSQAEGKQTSSKRQAKQSPPSSSLSSSSEFKSSAARLIGGEATQGQLVKIAHQVLDSTIGVAIPDSELRALVKDAAAKLHLRFTTGDQIGEALDKARGQRRTA